MGFWGRLVVVRWDNVALELDALQQEEPDWPAEPPPRWDLWHMAGSGWQVVNLWQDLPGEPEEFLQTLALETGSPALLAEVFDSDTAYVTAFSTSSGVSEGWIEARAAAGYSSQGDPLPGGPEAGAGERVWFEWIDARLPAHAVDLAAWADAAELDGDSEEILAVMRADYGFAEDRFQGLLVAMGIPARS